MFGIVCVVLLNYLASGQWRGMDRGRIVAAILALFSMLLIESGIAASKRFAKEAPADSGQAATRGAILGFTYVFPRWLSAMIIAWGVGRMIGFTMSASNEAMALVKGSIIGAIVTFGLGAVLFSRMMESARGKEE